MKKVLLSAIIASFLTSAIVMAASDVRVYVNGARVNEEVIIHNDRTYVPIRAVSEAMGADVKWDDVSRSAYITFTEDDAIAKIVSDVSPSVVAIIGIYETGGSVSYGNPTVHGTGVIYKSNGYIITNCHVIDGIKNLTVVLNDGTSLPGEVLYSDAVADLAVVKVNKIGLTPIKMANPEDVVSGKTAIAIGTPISMSLRNTVTKGIVSGCDVTLSDSYYKLLQTDASINPGNSGGPLLNTKGELIGINSSKFSGVGIDNMAFAIPVDTVMFALRQFEANGRIIRPELGITTEQSWEAKIGLPTNKGLSVKASTNSAIVPGDVINTVNGIEVHSISDWNEALKKTYNGGEVKIGYQRNGAFMEATINNLK